MTPFSANESARISIITWVIILITIIIIIGIIIIIIIIIIIEERRGLRQNNLMDMSKNFICTNEICIRVSGEADPL